MEEYMSYIYVVFSHVRYDDILRTLMFNLEKIG